MITSFFLSLCFKSSSRSVLLVFAAFGFGAPSLLAEEEPLNILFITGGGWHDFDEQKEVLIQGIGERLDATFVVDHEAGTDASAQLERFSDPDWAKGYDLVLYNISLSIDQTAATAQAIIDGHLKHGVPAVLLHGSIHSYRRSGNENWFRFLGARSMRHEAQRPFSNEVLKPEHPVMAGFPNPWNQSQGELYVIEEMLPTATALAHARGAEGEARQPTIWVNEYRGVRIFATTIGHHTETMRNDTYLDLVSRGIEWVTDSEKE